MKTIHKTILTSGIAISVLTVILTLHSLDFFLNSGLTLFSNEPVWPSQRDLRRVFWQKRELMMVYATGNEQAAEAYREYAEQVTRRTEWLKIVVTPDTALSREDMQSTPLSLLGVAFANPGLQRLRAALPVEFRETGPAIDDFFVGEENDIYLLSTYPNPFQRNMPVSIVTAGTDEALVRFLPELGNIYRRAGEFKIFRNGQGVVLGFFKQENQGPWRIDYEASRNYLKSMRTAWESPHFTFQFHGNAIPEEEISLLAEQYEDRLSDVLSQLGKNPYSPAKKIDIHLYHSPEDKGLMTGNTDLSHANLRRREVHAILNDDLQGADFSAAARILMRDLIGETESRALADGLALYFSHNWGKHGYRYWAARYYATGNVSPLDDLLNPAIYAKESYLVMRPLAAGFVAHLIDVFGWERFQALYLSWPEQGLPANLTSDVQELEAGWHTFLRRLQPQQVEPQTRVTSGYPVFQKGFCYAHEGYQIYNGYLSRKSEESLTRLNSLGTDWISITPFGYLDDRNKPGYFHFSFGAGAENDESVLTAFYAARDLGMKAMLKPHVLMNSRDFGWPGEVNMTNEADWQQFFSYYWSWIRHYAVLAEMYDFDIFCIGTELVHTTKDHQQEWREIIRRVRQLYNGPLVYAANWDREFEQVRFWDELDYIGLNCYYPLSKSDTATLQDLKDGAEQITGIVQNVAGEFDKPVLLTEVGFTSTAENWKKPHERRRDAPPSFEHQVMCYQAIFEAFWHKPWFYGFYWWKWPTYVEDGGRDHNGFTPCGKPAEEVVRQWYSRDRVVLSSE